MNYTTPHLKIKYILIFYLKVKIIIKANQYVKTKRKLKESVVAKFEYS